MLSFLGMTGYSRTWICVYAIKVAPLRVQICATGQSDNSATLQWTDDTEQSFRALKHANPDYNKPFHLYVAEWLGYACAVLRQDAPVGKKPLAYCSTELDSVKDSLPATKG